MNILFSNMFIEDSNRIVENSFGKKIITVKYILIYFQVFKVLDLHPLLEKKDWKDLCLKNSSAEVQYMSPSLLINVS